VYPPLDILILECNSKIWLLICGCIVKMSSIFWTCEECTFVLPFHVEFESFAHIFVATKTGAQLGAEGVTLMVLSSVNKMIHNRFVQNVTN